VRSARVKWLLHERVGNEFDIELVELSGADQYMRLAVPLRTLVNSSAR
jgi:hypothetical protein